MIRSVRATTMVAGVVGHPIRHSLSPVIHNAWLAAAAIDGVYVAFSPPIDRFAAFIDGLRGGAVRGLNVTAPFKELALAAADIVEPRATRAGAANLLVFRPDGAIVGDNTDGDGLLQAFAEQAPGFEVRAGPAVIFGAGGAGRGALATLLESGAPEVRLINRSPERAERLAVSFGAAVRVFASGDGRRALNGANVIINATPQGVGGEPGSIEDFTDAPAGAVVMDMVYRPPRTRFLEGAAARGLRTVDGLAMLIGQAEPSFASLFGCSPPNIDVRTLAEAELKAAP